MDECSQLQQNETDEGLPTDVESLFESTTDNSSVTNLTLTNGNDWEDVDEELEELIRHQFSQSERVHVNVAEEAGSAKTVDEVKAWLNKSPSPSDDINELSGNGFPDDLEDIQKMGAALADAVSNAPFDADAWTQIGEELDDQRVPGSEFVSNFITECQKRLPMALMNIIDICCTTNVEKLRMLHMDILQFASTVANGCCSSLIPEINVKNNNKLNSEALMSFAEYFSEVRLTFNSKISRKKQLMVKSVRQFVNESIQMAYETKSPVLFLAYANVPIIVAKCNEEAERGLGYCPEQVAKCGLQLQKAVYYEMVDKCLDFLASVGFNLRRAEIIENASQTSSGSSFSQHSADDPSQNADVHDQPECFTSSIALVLHRPDAVSMENGNSEREYSTSQEDTDEPENNVEVLRGSVDEYSPGGSMESQGSGSGSQLSQGSLSSWNSNFSSLPQFSPPETRVVPEINETETDNQAAVAFLDTYSTVVDLSLLTRTTNGDFSDLSTDASDADEPVRRRPRFE